MARALWLLALLIPATGCSSLDFGRFTPGASIDGGSDAATDTGPRDADGDDADATAIDTGAPVDSCNGLDDDGDMVIDEDASCEAEMPYCVAGSCEADQPEEVSAGAAHTCVRLASGKVACWGDSLRGQAGGDQSVHDRPQMIGIDGGGDLFATALSTGFNHSCALDRTERAYCWGDNTDGKLSSFPPPMFSNVAVRVICNGCGMVQAQHVAIGTNFSLFGSERTLYAGGDNSEGQFGNPMGGGSADGTRDHPDLFAENLASLTAGAGHACALLTNGDVYCWGRRGEGQTGDAGVSTPPVRLPMTYKAVDAGEEHNCAIDSADRVRCWGSNDDRQSGHMESSRPDPLLVVGAPNAVAVSAGGLHTCMIDESGDVYCWGSNLAYQLGTSDTDLGPTPTPTLVDLGVDDSALTISAGLAHTCVITTRRLLICWGDNVSNQAGSGGPEPVLPHRVDLSGAR